MDRSSTTSERSALISSASLHDSTSLMYLENRRTTLRRTVGYTHLFAFFVGLLIGSGVYISPGPVAKYSSNMATALAVWIFSGLVCLFCALCFCELATSLKKTGGSYIYTKETYGELAGFITMWVSVIVTNPAGLSIMAVAIGEHTVGAFADITSPNGIWMVKGVSILSVLLSCALNSASTSFTNNTQRLSALLQILGMVFFLCVGVWKVSTDGVKNYSNMFLTNTTFDYNGLSIAMYSALWSFDGWGIVASGTEELINPERDLQLAIVTGIPFVIICYILINLAFMSVLSQSEMAGSPMVASKFIEKAMGENFALVVPFIVAINCFASLNASTFFMSRNMLSAAREGHLPEPLSYIHKKRRTPVVALSILSSMSLIWILSLGASTEGLITYFSFAVWATYGVAISATIVLRIKQPDLPRPFKVWIVNPIFMCLVSAYLVIAPFVKRPVECSICLLITLLSIPIYFMVSRGPAFVPSCVRRYKDAIYNSILQHMHLAVCIYVEEKEDGQSKVTQDETILAESDKL